MFLILNTFFSTETFEVLLNVASAMIFLLQLIIVIRWRQFDRLQKLISFIVILTFLNEGTTWLLVYFGEDNLWIYHFYTPITFIFMGLVYSRVLKPVIKVRLIYLGILLFVIFAVINSLFIQDLSEFNSNTVRLSSIFYIVFSILYFFRLLKFPMNISLSKVPMFWLNTGVLVYYSGTLILFLVVDSVISDESDLFIASWILNALFNIVLLGFYSVALCLKPQD